MILALVLLILTFSLIWYLKVTRLRNQLSWLPLHPGHPIIGNIMEVINLKERLTFVNRLSLLYDGLFTFSVFNRIFILSGECKFAEFILSSNEIINKTQEYALLYRWLGTGLLTSSGKKWKTRRRLLTPAFHFSILEQFVEVMDSVGNVLISKLDKEVGNPCLDIYPFITLCSLDIICESTMGISINAQKFDQSDYVTSVKNVCGIIMSRNISALSRFEWFHRLTPNYWIEKRALKILHSQSNNVITSRMEQLKNKSDENCNGFIGEGVKKKMAFLDLLLKCTVDGQPLSHEDVREEVDTFMFEGHDTTASGLSFVLYCLSRNSKVQQKVFEEQKRIFGDDKDRPITFKDLQNMKYLEWCIKEALRLYPSVPYITRIVEKDAFYNGNIIPKGTNILIMIYCINRNPKYFENPNEFIPERFESIDGKLPFSNLPFSAGPRNCIGQKFAMLELKCIVAKILHNFELYPPVPEKDIFLVDEIVLKSNTGVHCGLKQRNWI